MLYDFDIFSVISKEDRTRYASLAARFGVQNLLDREHAMFRDPAAATALQGASESVRDCFVAAGFALNAFQTGVEPGAYIPSSGPRRDSVLSLLKGMVAALPDNANWNGFDIDAFFASAETARPTSGAAQIFATMRASTVGDDAYEEEFSVAAPPMGVFAAARSAA